MEQSNARVQPRTRVCRPGDRRPVGFPDRLPMSDHDGLPAPSRSSTYVRGPFVGSMVPLRRPSSVHERLINIEHDTCSKTHLKLFCSDCQSENWKLVD